MKTESAVAVFAFAVGIIVAKGIELTPAIQCVTNVSQVELHKIVTAKNSCPEIEFNSRLAQPNQLPPASKSAQQDDVVVTPNPAPQLISAQKGPKPATEHTRLRQQAAAERLGSSHVQSFEDSQRGLIAPLKDGGLVKDSTGRVVWNLAERATAELNSPNPDTVNPALWRQIQMLGIGGLFQVTERIYQVRGLDLANITFIEGETGLIVIDPLLCAETARAALELYYEHRPHRAVRTIIITHSHPDHFGGIYGVTSAKQVADGEVSVIAPKGFMDEVISENVLAGNVMHRRAGYMYGTSLTKGPTGDIGTGLGLGTPIGTTSLVKPTDSVAETDEIRVIDGLTFEFQLTPGSEAPAEMHLFIRELSALCTAENATQTMHNLYTLRGAKVRDAKSWATYLQHAVDSYADRTDVLFAPHHWPVWGNERVTDHLTRQRDLYKYIHDQTLCLANEGMGMAECAETIQLPKELEEYWANRGFYGCLNQNVKAVWNYYLGWFDGNPARLHPLPPREAGHKYLEFMGGIDRVVTMARESFEQGDYRWVVQVLDHAISAHPDHQDARELMADALEQLGYQAECGPWRNFYLSGAKELREGVLPMNSPSVESVESIGSMPLPAIFDSMAVRLSSSVAADRNLSVNFEFTDTDEFHRLMLKNGVLTHRQSSNLQKADCTVQLSRSSFDEILAGRSSFVRKVLDGQAQVSGSPRKLQLMFQTIKKFEPWFDIVPSVTSERRATSFEQDSL